MTTLARLSCWIPAEQSDSFEMAYQRQLVPILNKHGLDEPVAYNRPASEGVYSQLFAVETPAKVISQAEALAQDPAWQQALEQLGAAFGAKDSISLPYHFGTYQTPAGPSTTVPAGPGIRQGLWHSFSPEDGLPTTRIGDQIGGLVEDQHGGLWLVLGTTDFDDRTMSSVCRFDGTESAVWTMADGLVNNNIQALLRDRNGRLWMGTQGGVSRYEGGVFENYTTADGLVDGWINALLEDRHGRVWLATKGGISCFEDGAFKPFTAGHALGAVEALLEDRRGHLWFGAAIGLAAYDGQRLNIHALPGAATKILCLAEDHLGVLWIGTQKGLYRFVDGQFSCVTEVPMLPIRDLLESAKGHLWFAVRGDGIYGFDRTRWTHFTAEDGLISDQVLALTTDRQGNLWVLTQTGLSRYELEAFTHWTTRNGLPHHQGLDLIEDNEGRLWVSCNAGIFRFDGQIFTLIDGLQDKGQWVSSTLDCQGNLWFASANSQAPGAIRYDGAQYLPFSTDDGLASNRVFRVLADRRGHLWFTFLEEVGISRYDGDQFETFTTVDGLASNKVFRVAEDRRGHLWFDTWGGVCRFDGKDFTTYPFYGGVLLWDHRGHLWSKTFCAEGMFRYDGHQAETLIYPAELTRYRVHNALEDRQGHLWFGTYGGGVFRYDGRIFQRLTRREGLLSNQIETVLQDRQDAIWIATQGGLTRYRGSAVPPRVHLSAIVADRRYGPESPIDIPASQQLVAFEFLGKSLSTSLERMAYVYRLEGYDADWRPAYTGRAEYQELPEGEYTFQVKAVDRDLNYSEPAEIGLRVEPDALIESLTAALGQSGAQGQFVGTSVALRRVESQLARVAASDLTVLILGETGTGKGLAARTLHELSPRRDKAFVLVNCGSLPDQLIESELFGHERGAFTGALSRRLGKVELAQGGTLFLDEIGDMPMAAQVKLLRLLEERTFERVGGERVYDAQVRVVAATNRDLQQQINAGTFRQDLYYRLQGFEVHLPPLRERRDDIPLLALYFIGAKAAHLDKAVTGLAPAAEAALLAHGWPGNVRELQHAIERAVVVCQGPTIQVDDLGLTGSANAVPLATELVTLEEFERRYILQVLEQKGWVIAGSKGAASVLGLHEATLRTRMRKLGIVRPKT